MNNYYHQYHQDSMNEEEGVEFVPNAWSSELPADILSLITDKVRSLSLSEFIRFGSVCLEWRSFSIENYQHLKLPNQAPVLLIPIPPSLLAADHHHHQKGILSPPPPLIEVEEEQEEEEEEEEEKVEIEKREEETETTNDNENEKKEEDDDEEEEEEEEEEKEDDDDDDDDEEDLKEETFHQWENFYSPREIWGGQDANQRHKNRRAFYSLSEKMVYRDFQLPVPNYKNVVGSSYGWLVAVEECYAADDNGQLYLPVSLFNPFRTYNNEIQLPPMTQGNPGDLEDGETILDSYFLIKAFLSANPSSLSDPTTQLVVLGVYGRDRLAFCRPGDQSWTRLDVEDYRPIQDIICYQDQFFAVLQNGYVFAFILDADDQLLVTQGFLPPPEVRVSRITYLVESGGDLLQVWRYLDWLTAAESERPNPPVQGNNNPVEGDGYITNKFLVFKLDSTGEWVEMKTLNNRMLFIGTSSSMSLLASDFPGWSRPNSIYYTDDYCEAFVIRPYMGPHDIGIFNLSFERHYEAESKTILPSPIWIQPML